MSHRNGAPIFIDRLHGLRIGNISEDISTEDIVREFKKYGAIGDVYRSTDMGTYIVKNDLCFIRYFSEDDATNALIALDGCMLGSKRLSVKIAKQDSQFSDSTGYISNWAIEVEPEIRHYEFDPSMPDSHRRKNRDKMLSQVENVFTLKVENLTKDTMIENLRNIFGQYGPIGSIYYPVDLKSKTYLTFAFIRFLNKDDACRAQSCLDKIPLGIDNENITVSFSDQCRYFSPGYGDTTISKPRNASHACKFDIPI
mmetsp:Transcript_133/g.160  ORF Transcript_133/g.160 Transcript_133/m.160 type:complete len:255 (+) Transcript_133:226-990(+)